VFGSAYKSGIEGQTFTHYHVVLSDHRAISLSHKERQNLVLLSEYVPVGHYFKQVLFVPSE